MSLPTNNFDLIRLLAAAQVMLKHAMVHLGFDDPWTELLGLFPGVPVFFFISGFLIFQSFQNSRSARQFAINRVLRIYPALIVCFWVALGLALLSGYLPVSRLASGDFWAWAAAQLSFFQIYNWEALRGFGVGALNGSLWTVAVELQFYLLTPLLAWVVGRGGSAAWAVLIGLGVAANLAMQPGATDFGPKLYGVSFPPWLYMFMLGAWLSTRPDLQARLMRLPLPFLLVVYLLASALGHVLGWRVTGNEINPLSYLLLAALIYRLAFTAPTLSQRLLGHNDISYGVYIYHMPIINLLIHTQGGTGWGPVAVACVATMALALASWIAVERPALRLKRRALRKL